jgi:hypothetical protein
MDHEQDGRVWTGLIVAEDWDRCQASVIVVMSLGSRKLQGSSWLTETELGSREGLCNLKLVQFISVQNFWPISTCVLIYCDIGGKDNACQFLGTFRYSYKKRCIFIMSALISWAATGWILVKSDVVNFFWKSKCYSCPCINK